MALVVPSSGENALLGWALTDATTEDFTLKLYQNDYIPISTSVVGDFTEADFTSYAEKTLARSGWASIEQDANEKAAAQYDSVQSWTCGASGNTVYGYFVVGASSGTLLWCERFAEPQVMTNTVVLSLLPKFTLASEN